jgi:hypothetical protein
MAKWQCFWLAFAWCPIRTSVRTPAILRHFIMQLSAMRYWQCHYLHDTETYAIKAEMRGSMLRRDRATTVRCCETFPVNNRLLWLFQSHFPSLRMLNCGPTAPTGCHSILKRGSIFTCLLGGTCSLGVEPERSRVIHLGSRWWRCACWQWGARSWS